MYTRTFGIHFFLGEKATDITPRGGHTGPHFTCINGLEGVEPRATAPTLHLSGPPISTRKKNKKTPFFPNNSTLF